MPEEPFHDWALEKIKEAVCICTYIVEVITGLANVLHGSSFSSDVLPLPRQLLGNYCIRSIFTTEYHRKQASQS